VSWNTTGKIRCSECDIESNTHREISEAGGRGGIQVALMYPYLNVLLGTVGILLLAVLGAQAWHNNKRIRLVFFGYYLIVLQYNYDRVWNSLNFCLILGAGCVLGLWTYQAARRQKSTEVDG
jgi:hypothetical protein